MLRNLLAGGLVACAAGAALCLAVPATAQGSYSPYDETPSAALARYVRTLASDPKDFDALIGAGRAALAVGDPQAAAGFFARADEVDSRSPKPQLGMGAVQTANGEPMAALPYFTRAQQLGASAAMLGADRGLAYDLLGQQDKAQADYRAALAGPDADEARRRLALSLAIGGDRQSALDMLAPLSAKGDPAVNRVRAFVLALTGDSRDAMKATDAAMPGSWSKAAPFLQRLPTLTAAQKAAAVNLGIFPDSSGSTAYAYAAPAYSAPARTAPSNVTFATTVTTDRLTGIDALLRAPAAQPTPPPPTQVAYNLPSAKVVQHKVATAAKREIWLQLASGHNADSLSGEFDRIKSRHRDLFDGISGFVAQSPDRARLLIGPFRGSSDAEIFAEDLETVGVNAFKWTNSPADRIVPIATE